jgi:hypothetical protein
MLRGGVAPGALAGACRSQQGRRTWRIEMQFWGASSSCSGARQPVLSRQLRLCLVCFLCLRPRPLAPPSPHNPSGKSGVVRITSAAGERAPFQAANVTLPFDLSCAARACKAGKGELMELDFSAPPKSGAAAASAAPALLGAAAAAALALVLA